MKRYVAKEDVQKGLVDPTKPLDSQPAYKQKYQKEQKQRRAKFKQSQHQNQGQKQNQKYQQKSQNRNPRKFVDKKYFIDWKDITLQTQAPQKPKKILPKPDKQKFHNQLNQMKKKRQDLNQKKNDIRNQLKDKIKNSKQSNKTGFKTNSKFSGLLNQKHGIKNILEKQLEVIQTNRNQVKKELDNIREKLNSLYNPTAFQDFSKEALEYHKSGYQKDLSTANIDKKQQAKILANIQKIDRLLLNAKPQIQYEAQRSRLVDHQKVVKGQLDVYYQQWKNKLSQVKGIKKEIAVIYQQKKTQTADIPVVQNIDNLKQKYDAKIHKIQSQADDLTQKIKAMKNKHFKQVDDYQQQQQLLKFIEKIKTRQEQIKQQQIQREQRRKQRQERQAKRQKQAQERQKKKQQRKLEQQKRRKQQEQKRQKLKAQRQAYMNGNPHQQFIDLCKFLIHYCESFKPQNKPQKAEEKPQAILEQSQIKDKVWEKQLKKGCSLVVSKKNKVDQQAQKKYKKDKRKNREKAQQLGQKQTYEQLTHQLEMYQRFQTLKLIPPQTLEEIDNSIKELNDKIEIFNKPSQEQIQAYKERAGKQFDMRHGLSSGGRNFNQRSDRNNENKQRQRKKILYKEKTGSTHNQNKRQEDNEEDFDNAEQKEQKREKQPRKKEETNVQNEADFPSVN